MYMMMVRAKADAKGPDITGKIVPMPAGSIHQCSKADLSWFATRSDVFEIIGGAEQTTPAMMIRATFAELMANYPPSPKLAGLEAWCTDYPSVGGNGAKVICNGARWKSISQQHCILSPPSAVAGTLFSAGSAAALYGSTVLIPGGVLMPDDNIRLLSLSQHPTIGSVFRTIDVRAAITANGVVGGSIVLRFGHSNSSNNNTSIDKFGTLLNNTTIRTNANSITSGGSTTTTLQTENIIPDISQDSYWGMVVSPSADTSWLMYGASVYVEFAR